jgi:hypothetical protein
MDAGDGQQAMARSASRHASTGGAAPSTDMLRSPDTAVAMSSVWSGLVWSGTRLLWSFDTTVGRSGASACPSVYPPRSGSLHGCRPILPPPWRCSSTSTALDSFLALAALRPQRALLLHARDRQDEAARLATTVERRLRLPTAFVEVADDTDSIELGRVHAALPEDVHLHHTGGTGSMASLLCSAHRDARRPPGSASCLDEERRLLRFDDGRTVALADLVDPAAVELQTLLDLSGFARLTAAPDRRARAAGAEIVDRLVAETEWSALPLEGARAGDRALALLRERMEALRPDSGHLAHDGRWTNFLNGTFFEHLVAALARRAAPANEIATSVRAARGDTRVEIDVMAVGHYRPYVVSCTTDDREDTVKAKAWEVLARARQVVGLTARPVLATVLTERSKITPAQLSALTTVDAGGPGGRRAGDRPRGSRAGRDDAVAAGGRSARIGRLDGADRRPRRRRRRLRRRHGRQPAAAGVARAPQAELGRREPLVPGRPLAGGLAWLSYGIALGNVPLIVGNAVGVAASTTAIGVALRWREAGSDVAPTCRR